MHRNTKQIWGCQGLGEEGAGEWLLADVGCLWSDEKALQLDSGNGCTTLWIYKKTVNCTLKNGEFYGMWIILEKNKEMHVEIKMKIFSYIVERKKEMISPQVVKGMNCQIEDKLL